MAVATAAAAQDGGATGFDWLVAQHWDEGLRDGLLTLNEADLRRYVATGRPAGSYVVGPLVVEVRKGVYFAGRGEPHTPLDEPANVIVALDGRVLAGGKGYDFEARVSDGLINITHWNGGIGCTVSSWDLAYDLEGVWFSGSRYLTYPGDLACSPG